MDETALQVLQRLEDAGIRYEAVEHPAVFTMEEMEAQHLPHQAEIAKNLFLRDDKHRNYYLLTVRGDQRIDLKQLRSILKTRPLSFASEEDLQKHLKLSKGSVTPLGLLNDETCQVSFLLDQSFQHGLIGVHPDINTATVYLQADDLYDLIASHGNHAAWLDPACM